FLPKEKISQLPKTPGVYAFLASPKRHREGGKKEAKFLYIGKAVNLKTRVNQHRKLMNLAERVGYIKTDSEIDALILEARLIKRYQPKYNITWRDDKNYFYVIATQEAFPQIFITHQPKNEGGRASLIGPFVDGRALKETLKILRKVFPYRTCKKLPGHEHACLWYQLRRCPAPCLSKSSLAQQIVGFPKSNMRECQRNAKNLMTTLTKGKKFALGKLKKEMAMLAKQQKFETAARIRDQIASLEKIFAHSRVFESEQTVPRTSTWYCGKIESYDISNIQGKEATGAMVVFIDGEPDKSQYRQFKIKGAHEPNDIAMLKEVLERRLRHKEWPYPDLILIDGGKAQFNIAKKICSRLRLQHIKIMAIAKKNNELYIEGEKKPVLLKNLPRETFNLILQLRDEAHRFARRYHHKLRKKSLLD
ncbi:MAG: hypothetical protein A3D46_00150, partial [Candidatus Nealsonbacteria bacterium RIFCSPHIGHO2_02_FULL_43_13]